MLPGGKGVGHWGGGGTKRGRGETGYAKNQCLLLIARLRSFECNNPQRQGSMSPKIYLDHGILPPPK